MIASLFFAALAACSAPRVPQDTQAENDELLFALLPKPGLEERVAVIQRAGASEDARYLAPLVDLLRFADTKDEWFGLLSAIGTLLEEDLTQLERPWHHLTLRLAERDDLPLPEGYAEWKGELFARRVDPRFREFLHGGVATRIGLDEVVWGGVRVDGIPALVNPPTIRADEASYLEEGEPVFGVSLGGESRAYPLRILDWHEMANDVVGGEPIALAYCTLCGAGVLYRTRIGERILDFGSSGLLMRSNKLMFDRETKSLWNQMTGRPVIGPLVAEEDLRLEVLPVVLTSWGDWKARHPQTSVLALGTGHSRNYTLGAAYGPYFASERMMFPALREPASPGLSDKERVFVVRHRGEAKAFELASLRARKVWNERIGELPLVLVSFDDSRPVPLPKSWRIALEEREPDSALTHAHQLTWETLRAILVDEPDLIRAADVETLLALEVDTRLALLDATSAPTSGSEFPVLDEGLRNEVALRGLIGETRAYERGTHSFADLRDSALTDEGGQRWRVTEASLIGPEGELLERVAGHLAYGFGWDAFFPGGELVR